MNNRERREIARTEEWNQILLILEGGAEDFRRSLDTESLLTGNYIDDHRNAFYHQFAEIEMMEMMEKVLKTEGEWDERVKKAFAEHHR